MIELGQLAAAQRTCVVAPAGHGKTYLISEAVAQFQTGRQLILTHTHAGVAVLRRNLQKRGIGTSRAVVSTISAWALKYSRAYPSLSGITIEYPTGGQWPIVYDAAVKLLGQAAIRRVIRVSYAGIFVDEYQDCCVGQHAVVLALAAILPCRVLGDPLQAIFEFGGQELISWERDVEAFFEPLPELSVPHRWRQPGASAELGEWLLRVRKAIQGGSSIDLTQRPKSVIWIQIAENEERRQQQEACWDLIRKWGRNQTIAAIHKWPLQCHELARSLGGKFKVVEPIECPDLYRAVRSIGDSSGVERVAAVIKFGRSCLTGLSKAPGVTTAFKSVLVNPSPRLASYKQAELLEALIQVRDSQSLGAIRNALKMMWALKGVRLFRPENFQCVCAALQAFENGAFDSLEQAIREVRKHQRSAGRPLSALAMGRTLLVKGLEFDHVILLDADVLDPKNLYVALSRASRSVTVLSRSEVLRPTQSRSFEQARQKRGKGGKKGKRNVGQLSLFDER